MVEKELAGVNWLLRCQVGLVHAQGARIYSIGTKCWEGRLVVRAGCRAASCMIHAQD